MLQYSAAVSEARGSVKGNYNLAMLEMSLTGDLVKAREHFKFSSSFIKFPYSFLNWGNLEQSEYSPRQASVVMRRGTREVPNAYLSNNLAKAFLQLDEPDSAILEMKEALRLQPDNSAFYSNLGRIYMDYDKVDEAKKFLESGLDLPKVHRATVTNALFLNLRHGSKIAVSEDLLQLPHIRESWETNFNFAIDRYHQGDIEGARRLLTRGQPEAASYSDSTASGSLRADSLLLDGMLLFEKGEIARAISRMDFIDVNFPVYRPYTNHFLGVSFFGTGSPDMAAAFFRKSVEYGRTSDLLAEAQMEFDRGNLDYAFMQLNLARSQDSTLFDAVNLESTKLQLANGDYFFATIGFDPNVLKVADWMQIGLAAGKRGNKAAALEAFRRVIALDADNPAPYIEMARISMALGDSLALENLLPALEMAPNDISVNLVHAQILIKQGDVAQADAIVKKLGAASKDRKVRIVNAELAAAQGDTTNAISQFEQLRKENPIDPAVVLPLSRIYRAKRMDFEGQNMMVAAKDLNPENPDFWYEIAHFERLLVRPEEAGANALEAMKRATSLERSRQISEEFKEEIASFNALHPAGEEE
jgi:tetratricopeptide (TPR) repeat protein